MGQKILSNKANESFFGSSIKLGLVSYDNSIHIFLSCPWKNIHIVWHARKVETHDRVKWSYFWYHLTNPFSPFYELQPWELVLFLLCNLSNFHCLSSLAWAINTSMCFLLTKDPLVSVKHEYLFWKSLSLCSMLMLHLVFLQVTFLGWTASFPFSILAFENTRLASLSINISYRFHGRSLIGV